MIAYYIRLALKSFRRNPGLTIMMACAIGLGIAVSVVTITVYHAMSGNPIWWKADRLYAVTMDSWDPKKPFDSTHPELPPPQLTYRDAQTLYASNIPERKAIMATASGVLSGGTAQRTPQPVDARATTADFFSLFDVPFLYGSGWNAAGDRKPEPEPVMVLSRQMNDKLFGGENSVGRTVRWNDVAFRVIGVLDRWLPVPKFYDLNTGAFDKPEDIYVPLGWATALQNYPTGDIECWNQVFNFSSYREFLNSDCVWLQMWAELPDKSSRERMQSFVDAYWTEQHAAGRFQRPRNNRIIAVGDWLVDNNVVPNDNRMLVIVSLTFLAVCLINTVGILLAKFLARTGISGIRRALGASRREVFVQHFVEVGVVAAIGALLGLVLAFFGLLGVHALYWAPDGGGYQELTHFDMASIVWAIVLAIASAIIAGLYPAWRIGRLPPALHLKTH